jgi:hypothetical protein
MTTGREFRTLLLADPTVGTYIDPLDELMTVLLGPTFDPMTAVWTDAPLDGENGNESVSTWIDSFTTTLNGTTIHSELDEALEALIKIDGVTESFKQPVTSAVRKGAEALNGVITQVQGLSDSVNLQKRLDAFRALDADRPDPNHGNWDESDSSNWTGFGYFSALEALGAPDATAALAPLVAVAEAQETASGYAIFAAYASLTVAKFGESVGESFG